MKHVIVGTAGHIDHGKTALVKALTGTDTDRLKEEQQRGITIDIGFADLAVGDARIGFIDVPGHERFVKNMLAGAHGIDAVMLVVAADESIMPQTREHFDICRLLNVKAGLIALTKCDLIDEEILAIARDEVEEFVGGSFLEGAPIIAVSSRTGEGLGELTEALGEIGRQVRPKLTSALPRLPIDRAFTMRGFGTVVTGTLIAGELKVGDELEILPGGLRTRIRNLQVYGQDTKEAQAGQRMAANLQAVALEQVGRGMILAPAGRLKSTQMIDARLDLLPGAARGLGQRARVRLHHGTAEVMARVFFLNDDEDGNGTVVERSSQRQPVIEPGESGLVQFRLEEPVTALPGDRFIIRSYSPQITIGGGVVIDALPSKHRIRDRAPSSFLRRLEQAEFVDRIRIFTEMAGHAGTTGTDLGVRTGATDDELAAAVRALIAEKKVLEVASSPLILLSTTAGEELASRVLQVLGAHHKKEPLSLGLGREEMRERVFGAARAEIFRAVIADLSATGRVTAERDSLRLATHRPALSDSDSADKQRLESAFRTAGFQAVTLEEAAAGLKIPVERARKLYNLLSAERRLTRIGDLIFHADVIEDLKARVRAHKSVSSRIDVAVFKELTGGLTRKYVIPLLEFLDRERITRRIGNEREIL